ncbi:MAG TPA: hypothetical protein VNT26_16950, partial [Candidatus Sulfotelmatobacter sp.]|nr:hypothetical protein [Candidatus Sulfotelmatobacter sp.]
MGTYTYDRAVVELGPPDKFAKLTNGGTVTEWIIRRGGGSGFNTGTGIFGSHTGVTLGHGIG